MTCGLCKALRKPLPKAVQRWAEEWEASRALARQAKRERRQAGSNPAAPIGHKPTPPANPPPQVTP